jgi:hypothetical protein
MAFLGNLFKNIFGKKVPKYTLKTYQDNSKIWQQRFQKIDKPSLPNDIKSKLSLFSELLDQSSANLTLKDMEKIDNDIMPFLVIRLETSIFQNNQKTTHFCLGQITIIMKDRTTGLLTMTPIEIENMKQAYLEFEKLEKQEIELSKIETRLKEIDEKIEEESDSFTEQEDQLIGMEQKRLLGQKSMVLNMIKRLRQADFKRQNDLYILANAALTQIMTVGATKNTAAVEKAQVVGKENIDQFDKIIEMDKAGFAANQNIIQGETVSETSTPFKSQLKSRKQKLAEASEATKVKTKIKNKTSTKTSQPLAEEIEE